MPAGAEGSPFSYAIYRLVPRLERGERINAGVIVFSRPVGFLEARTALDPARALALAPELDLDAVGAHLAAIERIAAGDPAAGPDRRARLHRALPLAGRTVEHDDPAVRGSHRDLRRPGRDARTALRRARRRLRLSSFARAASGTEARPTRAACTRRRTARRAPSGGSSRGRRTSSRPTRRPSKRSSRPAAG